MQEEVSNMKLSPSVLQIEELITKDPEMFMKAVQALKDAGADRLHIDVMTPDAVGDSRFETIQKAELVKEASWNSSLPLDIHLMVKDAGRYIEMYRGAQLITVQPEYNSIDMTRKYISRVQSNGSLAGLAMNPGYSLNGIITPCMAKDADLLLFMTVIAGKGGQMFESYGPEVLSVIPSYNFKGEIQADGGIKSNINQLRACYSSGINNVVIGSGITQRFIDAYRQGRKEDALLDLHYDCAAARDAIASIHNN
jgi:ribulose-phosphate 3-epimerase